MKLTKLMNSNKLMNSGDEADEIQQALLHRLLGVLGDLRVRRQDQRWDRQSARLEMGSTIGKIFAFFMIRVTFAIGKTRDGIGKTRDPTNDQRWVDRQAQRSRSPE
jgi:hypothetical protein